MAPCAISDDTDDDVGDNGGNDEAGDRVHNDGNNDDGEMMMLTTRIMMVIGGGDDAHDDDCNDKLGAHPIRKLISQGTPASADSCVRLPLPMPRKRAMLKHTRNPGEDMILRLITRQTSRQMAFNPHTPRLKMP